jgi:hypothetical protein
LIVEIDAEVVVLTEATSFSTYAFVELMELIIPVVVDVVAFAVVLAYAPKLVETVAKALLTVCDVNALADESVFVSPTIMAVLSVVHVFAIRAG